MSNLIEAVYQEVEKWQPSRNYRSEIKYTEDLHENLRYRFRNSQVTRDDKNNKKGLDIGILHSNPYYGIESVGVELKYCLDKTTEFNRLIGQIETKGRQYRGIIIVLTGQTNHNMEVELSRWIKTKQDPYTGMMLKKIFLINKGSII